MQYNSHSWSCQRTPSAMVQRCPEFNCLNGRSVWLPLKLEGEQMKVTVMGGGSTYTPELVNGFLARTAQLPVTELWLMVIVPPLGRAATS